MTTRSRDLRRVTMWITAWAILVAISAASAAPLVHGMVSLVSLPEDFVARFHAVCVSRGPSEERCQCMSEVILREIADENLAVMLDYLENPQGFEARAALDHGLDEERLESLEQQFLAAQAAARTECPGR